MKMEFEIKSETITVINVYMREKREENYEKMAKIIEENREKCIIIGGDFNARTSEKGGKIEDDSGEEPRKSEDKISNKEGRILINWMEKNGVYIINGNTAGKVNSSMTYIGASGRSVIDYIITNRSGEEKIEKMEIVEGIFSDHLVLKVTLNVEITREEKLEKERETTRWTEEEILEYKKWLEMAGSTEGWKDLKIKISNAIP